MIYLILGLALIFRLNLINQSFWLDEAASLSLARLPLSQLFSAVGGDFHPPLFYLLLHFWLKLGITTEWFLRLPNVIFSVLSVWALYVLLDLIKTKRTANLPLIGTLLLALNPLHIYYSQELRMYSLNVLLTILSWYLLTSKKYKTWALINTLNFYTFYGAFFNLSAQIIYLFIYHRDNLKKIIPSFLFIIVLFLPWLPTLKIQLAGGEFLKNALPGWSQLSGLLNLKTLALIPLKFSLGRLNLSTSNLYLLTAACTSLYFLSLIFVSLKSKLSRLFLIWLLIPLILGALVSLKTPVLGYWRYLYLLPAFASLVALGISLLPPRLLTINLVVVVITLCLANLLFWLNPNSWREDWRQALSFAQNFNQSTTVSLFAFDDAFAPVKWYSFGLHYSAPLANLSSEPEKLDLALNQAVVGTETVLYFNYLSALTDPSQNIAAWLINAGYQIKQTADFPGVGFVYVYTIP